MAKTFFDEKSSKLDKTRILHNRNELMSFQITSYHGPSKFTLKAKLPFNAEIKFEFLTNAILKYVLKPNQLVEANLKIIQMVLDYFENTLLSKNQ